MVAVTVRVIVGVGEGVRVIVAVARVRVGIGSITIAATQPATRENEIRNAAMYFIHLQKEKPLTD